MDFTLCVMCVQALVQERTVQQEWWSKQQALLITTHEKYAAELTQVSQCMTLMVLFCVLAASTAHHNSREIRC